MLKRSLVLFLPVLLLAQAPKVTVTTRQSLGAPLSFTQADKNFTDLAAAANASQRAWGWNESTTTGLIWGYYGGPAFNGTTWTTVANGTVSLSASATNYVERTAAGVVSKNTTGWTAGKIPIALVTTGPSAITSTTDFRETASADGIVVSQSAAGSIQRTLAQKLGEFKSLLDFGADPTGVSDSTAAVQAWLNSLTQGTVTLNAAHPNGRLYVPNGTYKITSTINAPNSVSQFTLQGEGLRSSVFKWAGSTGVPMFKFTNLRESKFIDVGFVGNASTPPSYLVQVHRDSGQIGSGAATSNQFIRCWFGGDSAGMATTGVGYTAQSITYDSSNDAGFFMKCSFANFLSYGISFEHGNSLVHCLVENDFSNCAGAAVNTVHTVGTFDSGFIAYGCTSSGCASTWRLGGSTHGVSIFGWIGEGDTDILAMPTSASTYTLNLSLVGCSWIGGAGTANLKFDAGQYSSLTVKGGRWTAPSGIAINCPTAGSTLDLDGCYFNYASVSYNNTVSISPTAVTAVGSPTFTNLGSGILLKSGAAISYTPTVTNVGTSSISAKYMVVGRRVAVQVNITVNAAPTGVINVSLPVAPSGNTANAILGVASAIHGGSYYSGVVWLDTGGSVAKIHAPGTGNEWDGSRPFVWVSGDSLQLSFDYFM